MNTQYEKDTQRWGGSTEREEEVHQKTGQVWNSHFLGRDFLCPSLCPSLVWLFCFVLLLGGCWGWEGISASRSFLRNPHTQFNGQSVLLFLPWRLSLLFVKQVGEWFSKPGHFTTFNSLRIPFGAKHIWIRTETQPSELLDITWIFYLSVLASVLSSQKIASYRLQVILLTNVTPVHLIRK